MHVTNMRWMFEGASSFNQALNNWNVIFDSARYTNVTHMRYMFNGANSFNQPLHAPWYHEESESE